MTPEKRQLLERLCLEPKPTYVIDVARLRQNLETLAWVKASAGCKVFLALKSFAIHAVFPQIAEYLDGVSASSLNEVRLGAEYFRKEIHSYSPAFEAHEIDEICQLSDHVIFNSLGQYERFLPVARRHHRRAGLRLNVERSVSTYPPYDPSRRYSRFGVTAAELARLAPDARFEGAMVHNACGSARAGLDATLDGLEANFGDVLRAADWVNLGGSHYITNPGYDLEHLVQRIRRLGSTYDIEVHLEPGYAVTCNAGYLCARVVDVFTNEKQVGVLNVAPSAHFMCYLEMGIPVEIVGATPPGSAGHTYVLGGNTCLSADVLGEYTFPEPLEPGSPLILEDMIAYTIARSTMFNGVQMPSIALLDEDLRLIPLRESGYADFKRLLA